MSPVLRTVLSLSPVLRTVLSLSKDERRPLPKLSAFRMPYLEVAPLPLVGEGKGERASPIRYTTPLRTGGLLTARTQL